MLLKIAVGCLYPIKDDKRSPNRAALLDESTLYKEVLVSTLISSTAKMHKQCHDRLSTVLMMNCTEPLVDCNALYLTIAIIGLAVVVVIILHKTNRQLCNRFKVLGGCQN